MRKLEMFFKKLAKRILFILFKIVDICVPKDNTLWVFANGGRRYWGSNLRAVFEIAKTVPDIQAVIVNQGVTSCSEIMALYDSNVTIVPTVTFSGMWALLRAHVVFVTHGVSDVFWPLQSKKRLLVNLWHGMPLKGIGFLEAGSDEKRHKVLSTEKQKYSAILSSSKLDRLAMMACFNLEPAKVWLTGLPRNDWLIQVSNDLPSDLHMMERRLKDLIGNRKLVLYAPTFRDNSSGLYTFSEAELESLRTLLRNHNAVLGIRSHINRESRPTYTNYPEFLDLGYSICPEPQILLRITQVLVTDYSGIWLDYLLLKTCPVIGFVHDWDVYVKERGFLYDYESLFPGTLAHNYIDFESVLALALEYGIPANRQSRYDTALAMFHAYQDGKASQRVVKHVKMRVA